MLAIVAGLAAALSFTLTTLCSTQASRLVGAPSTLAGVTSVGLAVGLPIALLSAPAPALGGATLAWVLVAGIGNVLGLFLSYTALRVGAVGIVATIASTEGALAALISIIAGEAVVAGVAFVLAVIAAGVALAASAGGHELEEGVPISRSASLRAAGLAIGAAVAFGAGIYATGRVGGLVPLAWAILPARVVGVGLVAMPLTLLGRTRITRAAAPFIAAGGLGELTGFVCFVIASREGIAVASVMTSLFAPFAAVGAYVLFRERLAPRQVVGVAVVVVGVMFLGVLRA